MSEICRPTLEVQQKRVAKDPDLAYENFRGTNSSKPAEELEPGSYAISLILMGLLSPGEREITLKAASRTTYQHGVFPHQRDCVRAGLCGKVHPGILLVLLSRLLSNTSF